MSDWSQQAVAGRTTTTGQSKMWTLPSVQYKVVIEHRWDMDISTWQQYTTRPVLCFLKFRPFATLVFPTFRKFRSSVEWRCINSSNAVLRNCAKFSILPKTGYLVQDIHWDSTKLRMHGLWMECAPNGDDGSQLAPRIQVCSRLIQWIIISHQVIS